MVRIVIHCSDSGFGNASLITKWHTLPVPQGRGWDNIGYHYVILNGLLSPFKRHSRFDGYVETGRPLDDDKDITPDEYGAHTFGYNDSVGICLIGLSGAFSQPQIHALRFLIRRLKVQFKNINVVQHSDLDKKKPNCAGLSQQEIILLNSI